MIWALGLDEPSLGLDSGHVTVIGDTIFRAQISRDHSTPHRIGPCDSIISNRYEKVAYPYSSTVTVLVRVLVLELQGPVLVPNNIASSVFRYTSYIVV